MIATLDQYIAAYKQRVVLIRTGYRTVAPACPASVLDLAGQPGAGVLAGTNASAGVMPTDATPGCPDIQFTTGVGYLSKVEFSSSVPCRLALFDLLFKAGYYLYNNGTTSLTGQPVISSRCPDTSGSYFGAGNEIWIEAVNTFSQPGWNVYVTYTNQAGVTGCMSGMFMAGDTVLAGRLVQLPLASGDTGAQKIESVVVSAGGVGSGALNVLIVRPLWTSGRVAVANGGDIHDMLKTGLPIVYSNSALFLQVCPDGTITGVPELNVEIASA